MLLSSIVTVIFAAIRAASQKHVITDPYELAIAAALDRRDYDIVFQAINTTVKGSLRDIFNLPKIMPISCCDSTASSNGKI